MGQFRTGAALQAIVRFAFVLALGALTGGCFQPLYGSQTLGSDESVRDKLSLVDIPEIKAANGTPDARMAVSVRNALLYDFNGGQTPASPTYRLVVTLSSGKTTVITSVTSGLPTEQLEMLNAIDYPDRDCDQEGGPADAQLLPGHPMTFPVQNSVLPHNAPHAMPKIGPST